MGKQAKIKSMQRELRYELSKINQDLTVEQKEQVYKVARQKMLKDFFQKTPNKESTP